MKPVIAFDWNGTLLDLAALDLWFEKAFGDARARRDWFAEVLNIALTTTVVCAYAEFSTITFAHAYASQIALKKALDPVANFRV